MRGLLRVVTAPAILAVLAFTATSPVDVAPVAVAPMIVPASVPAIVASGSGYVFDVPEITVTVPKPPPRAVAVHHVRVYGSAPALSGSVLAVAAQGVGVRYVAGGSGLSGFDCSGFTSWVYRQLGVSIPRTVLGQRNVGTVTSSPVPGDIIWTSGHVALYVAPGWQIDAPRPGKTVQVRPIWQTSPIYIHLG